MKSIRANPTAGAAEGDERIRTAVCSHGAIRTIPTHVGVTRAALYQKLRAA